MKTAISVQILPGFNYMMHFDFGMWCLVSGLGQVAINESKKYYCHFRSKRKAEYDSRIRIRGTYVLGIRSQRAVLLYYNS